MENNKPPKKVAIILPELYVGGAEKLCISLVNNFIKNGIEAHFISIIYTSEKYDLLDELDPKAKVKIFTRKRKYDFFVGKKVIEYLEEEDIRNIMIIELFVYFLIRLPLLFRKLKGKKLKVFLSLHSTTPQSIKDYVLNFLYSRFVNQYTKILYICEVQKRFFKKKYFLKSTNETVIYNGVDSDYFSKQHFADGINGEVKSELRIPQTHKVIVKVGRMSFEKGHSFAIQSLKILHDRFGRRDTHLLFIGGGSEDYINSLKSLAHELCLNDFIHFTGNKKDVRPYYLISDLFTLTSLTEAFSLAALEAMSFGLPCSLTDVGGASEMIIPGRTGLLSKAKDALSIAETWNSILNSKYSADTIRSHVTDKFSAGKMFENYYSAILR